MQYTQLLTFVQDYLPRRMQHIYLPLLIGELVDSGGSATLRQLALSVLANDESQVMYYEKRLKEMPLKVLNKHGIISRDGDLISLNIEKLTFEQKSELKMLCQKALGEFINKKGLGIWDYRLLDNEPIPDSLRYRVLKESDGKCCLCGATKKDRPLDVDHIKPRSRGGKNVYENLQVLCSKCNRSKGNKDDTDFRDDINEEVADCKFCYSVIKDRIIDEYDTVTAILDGFPVSNGHTLIIPKRHTSDWFSLTEKERRDSERLIQILKNRVTDADPTITGFNIGMNSGESAGQTIFHCHIHLIPRRDGDTPSPRGGVRGVIPGKMDYQSPDISSKQPSAQKVSNIHNYDTERLLDNLKLWDPGSIQRTDIPIDKGIYVYFNKSDKTIGYIGRAIGQKGLRGRIWNQHLSPTYLEPRESKFSHKDTLQIAKEVYHNGKIVIEKSAFRKNLARKHDLRPGEECLYYLKNTFDIALIPLPNMTGNDICNLEKKLIASLSPFYNENK